MNLKDLEPKEGETPEEHAKRLAKLLRVNSRWNYIACGASGFMALFFAMAGNLMFGILQLFFCWWNWNLAEDKRQEEIADAIEESKNPPKEQTPEDAE
jgi:hypothetical protein